MKLADLRIGYVKSMFEEDYPNRAHDAATLDKLRELGAELEPVELPAVDVTPLGVHPFGGGGRGLRRFDAREP